MRYHERTRRRGVNSPVYWLVRAFLQPFLQIYFRLGRNGRQHIPAEGGVLLASNHRSFLDPFVIGCCLRRPIFFVAKQELFKYRPVGWILNCLGAFPVRRGESDEESVKTALALLERGDAVVIFPEGTRIRRGALKQPKRGVGRLALESGAPVVPIAVHGSEHARRGLIFKPVKVKLRIGRPLTYPRVEQPSKSPRASGPASSSSTSGSAACRRCARPRSSAPGPPAPPPPRCWPERGLTCSWAAATRAVRSASPQRGRTRTTCRASRYRTTSRPRP